MFYRALDIQIHAEFWVRVTASQPATFGTTFFAFASFLPPASFALHFSIIVDNLILQPLTPDEAPVRWWVIADSMTKSRTSRGWPFMVERPAAAFLYIRPRLFR